MKFYIVGRKIRGIDELEEGKQYAVCGIVGTLVIDKEPDLRYRFVCKEEEIYMSIARTALMDRIHFGMVRIVKREFHPREKTIAKIFAKE